MSDNPFSFKAFIASDNQTTPQSQTNKSPKKQNKNNPRIVNTTEFQTSVPSNKEKDNPFSFTKLFPSEGNATSKKKQSLQISGVEETDLFKASDSDDDLALFGASSNKHSKPFDISLKPGLDLPRTSNAIQQLPSPSMLEHSSARVDSDRVLFSDDDDDDIFNDSSLPENNTMGIPDIVPYGDGFGNYGKINNEIDHNTGIGLLSSTDSASGLHDNNNANKQLLQELAQVREENQLLKLKLTEWKRKAQEETQKVNRLSEKMQALKKKEVEETAALEEIIQQVESNLKITTERAVLAEHRNDTLTEDASQLREKVSTLTVNNKELLSRLNHSGGGGGGSESQVKYVSQQLSTAAKTAEQSLRQLLGGVDNLKQLAEILLSAERFSEISTEDGDGGGVGEASGGL